MVDFNCGIKIKTTKIILQKENMLSPVILSYIYYGDLYVMQSAWTIALFNVIYRIYSKALQIRLQPIPLGVIIVDETMFLPLTHILDNMSLTHETLAWAKHSYQKVVFRKLDFANAYDKLHGNLCTMQCQPLGYTLILQN